MVTIIGRTPIVTSGVHVQHAAPDIEYEWCKKLIDSVNPAVATSIQRTQMIQCAKDHPSLDPTVEPITKGGEWVMLTLFACLVFACFIPFLDDGSKR